jgi:uncharacterized membrane protein
MAFSLFPWKRNREFFIKEEQLLITEAIRNAERQTSGEVRIFVESRCAYMDAVDRAAELFFKLEMDETKERNAVLIYLAIDDHQLAVFGDEGIHQKVGTAFWNEEVQQMIKAFNRHDYALGLKQCISDVGNALHIHFPFDHKTDKNELPDEILFGR